MRLKKIFGRSLIWLLGALAVAYAGDWGAWRLRLARGAGMGSVVVNTVIVTPLKGNKEEYDLDGTGPVACSRSIFPQAGAGACWWLSHHNAIYER